METYQFKDKDGNEDSYIIWYDGLIAMMIMALMGVVIGVMFGAIVAAAAI